MSTFITPGTCRSLINFHRLDFQTNKFAPKHHSKRWEYRCTYVTRLLSWYFSSNWFWGLCDKLHWPKGYFHSFVQFYTCPHRHLWSFKWWDWNYVCHHKFQSLNDNSAEKRNMQLWLIRSSLVLSFMLPVHLDLLFPKHAFYVVLPSNLGYMMYASHVIDYSSILGIGRDYSWGIK